jgi:hypothetical protein
MNHQQAIYAGVALLAALIGAILVCRGWLVRRGAYVVDHFRIELHDAHVIEDRVLDVVWRAAVTMTNTTRCPQQLPVLAERATATVGRMTYLAYVYLDTNATELNPDDVALAWVESVLPAGAVPRLWSMITISARSGPRTFQFTTRVRRPANEVAVLGV